MFGPVDLGGAGQRLLPESIPARFFGVAVFAHVAAWIALAWVAEDLPGFSGGPGPVLAAIHVLTLGVLLLTAMGASFQMLPVALGRLAPPVRACKATFWLFIVGAILLVFGFAQTLTEIIFAGAIVTGTSVVLYVITLARVVRGAQELRTVLMHVWAALASLAAAAGLALALTLDYDGSFLPDHANVAVVHAVLAGYGFMGMLALGLSQVVVPLFAVALVPYSQRGDIAFLCAVTGLLFGVIGLLIDAPLVVVAAGAAALFGVGFHVHLMVDMLNKRVRRLLGPEFLLIRVSWVLLPVSLVLGVALYFDWLPGAGPALFGFVLLYGWLLTLLTGVLQRIVPLLGSMHTGTTGNPPVAPSQLVAERPLMVHRWGHLAALALVAAGLALDLPVVIRLGALVGTVAAAALAAFAIIAFRRMHVHIRASRQTGKMSGTTDAGSRTGSNAV